MQSKIQLNKIFLIFFEHVVWIEKIILWKMKNYQDFQKQGKRLFNQTMVRNEKGLSLNFMQTTFAWLEWVFATNYDFLIFISLQPNVVYIVYIPNYEFCHILLQKLNFFVFLVAIYHSGQITVNQIKIWYVFNHNTVDFKKVNTIK